MLLSTPPTLSAVCLSRQSSRSAWLTGSSRTIGWLLLALSAGSETGYAQSRPPVFDVHMHTLSTPSAETAMRAMMDSLNVSRAMMIGTPVELARQARDSSRFLRGLAFPCEQGRLQNSGQPCFANGAEFPDTAWLRAATRAGEVQVFGEIGAQYMGVMPNDPRMMPFYALAESLDVPVGIHLGIGPSAIAYPDPKRTFPVYSAATGDTGRRVTLQGMRQSAHYSGFAGDPRLLETVLTAHPKLRVYIMHAAWPFQEALLYMMAMHPQLYADLSVLQYSIPRKTYYRYLRELVEAGFADRLMFGSDGGAAFLKEGVQAILDADFLTEAQKRGILYDNAARFFRIGAPPR